MTLIELPFKPSGNHIADVADAIEFFHKRARLMWPSALKDWKRPIFTTGTLTGTTAGRATYSENKIEVNWTLYKQNLDTFLRQTIGHEVAHLTSYHVFGREGTGHGQKWKHVMSTLGLPPDRCHKYDVTSVKKKRK